MFAAVVDALDQAIGQVLKTLEDEGIEEETLILFSSDNGGAAYAGGGADNFPLRGGKGDTYEGGIRVIAAMKWKGVIKENSNMDQVMTVMDIFPTLSSAAKVNMNVSKNHQSHDNLDERLLVNALNATYLQLQSGSRQLEKTVA